MVIARFTAIDERYVAFKVSGHADYAEFGNDVVCASVTSAVQLTANGITEVLGIPAEIDVGENHVMLKLPADCIDETACNFIAALRLHLSLLNDEFEGVIQLINMEV